MTELREGLLAADRAHVWHPYTPMGPWLAGSDPLVVMRAEGVRLHDADGRAYLDANASWWVSALGHGHPRLVAALVRQAQTLAHCALAGIVHEPAARLAEELALVAPPGLSRVFFSDDGSTAVEAAVKLCLQLAHQTGRPRRTRLLALEQAFHGDTLGATSLGGVEVFRRPFASALLDCVRVAPPADAASLEAAFDALGRAIRAGADELAAVVVEPIVQGAAGMRIYPPAFLRHLRELCTAHDIPLVADEVFTGYGRTGPMWACEHAGVVPDLLCTAKAFSGGMLPMAATLASDAVFEGFLGDRDRAFLHGHSFTGNPLGAAVAREVLAVYRDERILERAAPKAARIAEAFRAMGSLPHVRATRALGMIGALDLDGDEGYLADAGWRVARAARDRGVYLRPLGNVVYVTPALNIGADDLDDLLGRVADSVAAALSG